MRCLGIDLGNRRSGLALADDFSNIVTPIGVVQIPVQPPEPLINALAKEIREQDVDTIVMGLPLNMDDTVGHQAEIVIAFSQRLANHTKRTIHLFDERLTSAEADWAMAGTGMTHKQKKLKRDALAAAALLRTFLAATEDQRHQRPITPQPSHNEPTA